jgi:hypothetical protein
MYQGPGLAPLPGWMVAQCTEDSASGCKITQWCT